MAYHHTPSGLLLPANFAEPRPELREIATTLDGRDITRGYVQPMALLAPQDAILQTRGAGDWAVYQQVKSDPQVGAVLQQRRLAVTKTEWQVVPGGEKRLDRRAAELLEETLERIRWDAVTAAMHWGVFYGWAVAECLWAREGARIVLDAVRVRDRTRFAFDGAGRLRLKTLAQADGEILPDRKFWVFGTGADHDDEPYGLGLAHWLYWPVLFKRANIKFWLIAAEKFGSPTALGVFPPNATPAEQAKLLAALQAIQTDAGLIVPEGMQVELLEAKRAGGADYAALCDYMDAAIAKLVLGQVMTSEAVGGQYKAEVQDAVKDDIVKSDADLLCDSFNRGPVRWLIDFNFPGAAYPKVWRQTEEPEDLGARAERERKVFEMGYRPTLRQVTDTYGGEWEVAPSAQGQPAPGAPAEGEGDGAAASFAEGGRDTPDTPERQTAVLARAAAPLVDAMLAQIRRELDAAPDLATFGERLLALYPELDGADLTELLGQAFASAELGGRLEASA